MKKIIIILSVLVAFSIAGILYAKQGPQEEQPQYQVIRLSGDELQPSTATISLGTMVIWINEAPGTVDIQFSNDKIAAHQIPCAGLDSTYLVQKGEFDYVVSKGLSKLTGKIIVQ